MMYTLICVYCHISAQIGLVITIHVEEFCFGFDEQESTACQLICCIKKKNFGILQCLPFSGISFSYCIKFLVFLCNLQNYRSQIEVFLSLVSDRFALEIIARLRQTSIVRDKGSFKLKISECGIFTFLTTVPSMVY